MLLPAFESRDKFDLLIRFCFVQALACFLLSNFSSFFYSCPIVLPQCFRCGSSRSWGLTTGHFLQWHSTSLGTWVSKLDLCIWLLGFRQDPCQTSEAYFLTQGHRVKGLISKGLITFGYFFGVFLIQTISRYWISFVSYCQSKGYPKAI
jgi:hypothetical protein